jgi:hypothetical protein
MRRQDVIIVAFVVPTLTALLCPWSLFSPRPPGYRECYGYRVVESDVQVRCEEAGKGKWTNHIDGKFIVTNTAEEPIHAHMSVSLWDPDRRHPTSFFKCQPTARPKADGLRGIVYHSNLFDANSADLRGVPQRRKQGVIGSSRFPYSAAISM